LGINLKIGAIDVVVAKETFPEFLEFILLTFIPQGSIPTPIPCTYHAVPKFSSKEPVPYLKIAVDADFKLTMDGVNVFLIGNGKDLAVLKFDSSLISFLFSFSFFFFFKKNYCLTKF